MKVNNNYLKILKEDDQKELVCEYRSGAVEQLHEVFKRYFSDIFIRDEFQDQWDEINNNL